MAFITQMVSWLKIWERAKSSTNPMITDDVTTVQDDLTKDVGTGFLVGSTAGLCLVPSSRK